MVMRECFEDVDIKLYSFFLILAPGISNSSQVAGREFRLAVRRQVCVSMCVNRQWVNSRTWTCSISEQEMK